MLRHVPNTCASTTQATAARRDISHSPDRSIDRSEMSSAIPDGERRGSRRMPLCTVGRRSADYFDSRQVCRSLVCAAVGRCGQPTVGSARGQAAVAQQARKAKPTTDSTGGSLSHARSGTGNGVAWRGPLTRPKAARVLRGVVILVLALRLVEQLLVVLEALRGGPPHNRRDCTCTSVPRRSRRIGRNRRGDRGRAR